MLEITKLFNFICLIRDYSQDYLVNNLLDTTTYFLFFRLLLLLLIIIIIIIKKAIITNQFSKLYFVIQL